MSEITKDLKSFAARIAEDGYPPALLERAAARMEAMEKVMVGHNEQISLLTTEHSNRLEALKKIIERAEAYERQNTFSTRCGLSGAISDARDLVSGRQ